MLELVRVSVAEHFTLTELFSRNVTISLFIVQTSLYICFCFTFFGSQLTGMLCGR